MGRHVAPRRGRAVRNLRWALLAASAAATPAFAQERAWTGASPSTALWSDGDNWDGATPPAPGEDAVLGLASYYFAAVLDPAEVNRIRFLEASPDSYFIDVYNDFVITGGIENQSSLTQVFTNGGGTIRLTGGTVTGPVYLSNNSGTLSIEGASAGSLSMDNYAQVTFVAGNGGQAVINNGMAVYFDAASNAGSAAITNTGFGTYTGFGGGSTAGSATLTNDSNGARIFFEGGSDAGTATILNRAGTLTFNDTSSAAGATIDNSSPSAGARTVIFNASSTAGAAQITTRSGSVNFYDTTSAGTASITANTGGSVLFQDSSSAGSATLTAASGGTIAFRLSSSGASARLIVQSGGTGQFSQLSGASTTIGSIEGAGTLALGNKELIAGGNGASTVYSGTITGAGGKLTKTGTGTLELGGTNSFGGGTTLSQGGLRLASSGALGNGSLTVAGGTTLGYGDAVTNAAAVTMQGTADLEVTTGSAVQSGALTGAGGIRKTGAGTLTLSGINTHGGGTTVTAGTLRAVADGALGGSVVVDGGTLAIAGAAPTISALAGAGGSIDLAGNLTVDQAISTSYAGAVAASGAGRTLTKRGSGALTLAGAVSGDVSVTLAAGTLTLDGANSHSRTVQQGGVLVVGSDTALGGAYRVEGDGRLEAGRAVTIAANMDLAGSTLTIGGAQDLRLDGSIQETGTGALVLQGAGKVTLAGANGYSGGTDLQQGMLVLAGDQALGTGGLAMADGTRLRYAGDRTIGNAVVVAGAVELDVQGNDHAVQAGAIAGGGTVTKTGTGWLEIAGDNSGHGGAFDVAAGRLVATGTLGGVTVRDGATLAGTGRVGDTVIESGGRLAGLDGQTLRLAGLVLQGGARVDAALGAPGGAALFDVAGDLTLDGTLDVRDAGGFMAGPGLYRLASYGGALTDNGLDIGSVPGGVSAAALSIQTSVAGQVNLLAYADDLLFWDGGDPAVRDNGTVEGGAGVWNATAATWTRADGAYNGAMQPVPGFAVFGGTSGTVTLDDALGALSVTGMQFASDGYRIEGDALALAGTTATIRVGDGSAAGNGFTARIGAALGGAAMLDKTDGGTLILTGANSYSGGTRVSGGTLRIGDGGTSGAIVGDAAVSGTLAFDRADAVAFAGAISGAGTLVQAGQGMLTLSGDGSAFAGATRVDSGTLRVTGTLGSGASTLRVGAGAALAGSGTLGGEVAIADGGSLGGVQGATLRMGGLTLAAGARVEVVLGAPGGAPALFDVAGDLVLDGTLDIVDAGQFGAGVYRLFDYGGALTDNGLAVGGRPAGLAAGDVYVQTAVAHQVNLVSSTGATLGFWDGGDAARYNNGAVDGGAGSWSAAGRNWTDAAGSIDNAMAPQPGFAVFQGTGGTVTVDRSAGAVGVTGMQFAVDGYRIKGDALDLAGSEARIRVGDGSAAGAGYAATIAAALGGGATLVKTDLGTLVLTGANSYSGGTVIEAGTLVGNVESIRGDIRNDGRLVFDQASDARFAGAVSGTGQSIKSGAGTLTLGGISGTDWSVQQGGLVSATARFTGDLDVADGARFTFDQAGEGSYAGSISGAGEIRFTGGGGVQLTGDSSGFTGDMLLDDATLSANGTMRGRVRVASGGLLKGNGVIGGAEIGGHVAPGNSIGTLTIDGNIVFTASGVYEVEFDAAGQSDRIVATGSATLGGASVMAIGSGGNYAPQTDYVILTAAGGIAGTFGGVTTNLAFLTPLLRYTLNSVVLRVQRNDISFASIGQTANQRNVAEATEGLGFGNPVFDAVVNLSAGEARAAFDQLAGDDFASLRGALVDDTHFVRDAMTRRAGTGIDGPAVWGQAIGARKHAATDGTAAGYHRDIEGVLAGFEGGIGAHWRLGAVAGFDSTELRTTRGASQRSDAMHVGAYATGSYGGVTIALGAAHAAYEVGSARGIAFPGTSQSLSAHYDMTSTQVFGEVGYRAELGALALQPFAGIAHVRLGGGGFDENGGAAALHGGEDGFAAIYGTLGLKAQTSWDLGGARFGLDGSAGARRVLGGRTPITEVALTGSAPFEVRGAALDRTSAAVDLGIALDLGSHLRLGVSYSGSYGDRATDHGGRAQLSWRF